MDAWKAWWSLLPNLQRIHNVAEILGWISAAGILLSLIVMWWTGGAIDRHRDSRTEELQTQLSGTQTALLGTRDELRRTQHDLEEARSPRSLTAEQQAQLVAMLRTTQLARVDILTLNGDPEAFGFGTQIGAALRTAGWQVNPIFPTLGIPPGLLVLVHHGEVPDNARVLSNALGQVGFQAPITDNPTPIHGDLGIVVGSKPR